MTLDARHIALQGIGYGVLFVALQGFATAEAPPPPNVQVGPAGRTVYARRPLRNEDEEIIFIISAALQVLDIN